MVQGPGLPYINEARRKLSSNFRTSLGSSTADKVVVVTQPPLL
jgi:hypothetical protein